MKNLFLFLLIAFAIQGLAQSTPKTSSSKSNEWVDTVHFSFDRIIELDSGLSQSEIYSSAREWFSKSFANAKSVLDMDDKEAGKLIGHGSLNTTISYAFNDDGGYVTFDISLYVKPGKYRIQLNNFQHHHSTAMMIGGDLNKIKPQCGTFNLSMKYWREIKVQSFDASDNLMATLNETMVSKKKSDW